ncbi:DoxX family protein [Luteolibacter arcticus]|uniref:DoxX family protein n=1 Tax=Luteolibacter arcticus TaxID=1581411 RepID=A0ABT3GKN9_9BACT|nr:DoxX family protein [Luteolibacter arcticus]MCW1924026.1 DoxX family protein [Luteolibacter arcticus]
MVVIMNQDSIPQLSGQGAPAFKAMPRTATVIKSLVVLFLAFDGITKVLRVKPVMEACQKMGISPEMANGIGLLLLVCTAFYVVPRTSILGAVLLTGYLGGAAATHVLQRTGSFPVVFAVGFGVLAWLGLLLRYPSIAGWMLKRP